MIDILFTDTHFGWKNNSMNWLNSQMKFIYEQFIPTIKKYKKKDKVRVIHLGDVFDSRSTVSTYVASKVVKAFKEIRDVCDEFVIVCGNHDFYSPNSDMVNTVELLMSHLGITIVDQNIYEAENHCYIPWYVWQNGNLPTIQSDLIFTHADIVGDRIPDGLYDKTIFSGHIHTPSQRKGLYNLGSCFALTFADSNTCRGFYIIENGKIEFIKNETSIKFHRIYNEDVLKCKDFGQGDYIELYVTNDLIGRTEYVDAIKWHTERYTHLWVIPQVSNSIVGIDQEHFENYDIEKIMEDSIPNDLKDMYSMVKKYVVENC